MDTSGVDTAGGDSSGVGSAGVGSAGVGSAGVGSAAVELHLPGLLADDAGGRTVHRVDAADVTTVADLLDAMGTRWPRLERRLRDETGQLRPYVNVFVGVDDVRWADGLATGVRPGDVVLVLPSVAGG